MIRTRITQLERRINALPTGCRACRDKRQLVLFGERVPLADVADGHCTKCGSVLPTIRINTPDLPGEDESGR